MCHIKTLQTVVFIALLFASSVEVFAGGFDSSGQPFDIIFGEKHAVRFSLHYLEPAVDLEASRHSGEGQSSAPLDVSNMAKGYAEALLAFRYIVNERTRCATQLERPFRYFTRYQDDSLSYVPDSNNPTVHASAPVTSKYQSASVSLACSYSVPFSHSSSLFSTSKLSIIAGPKYQEVSGVFSSDTSASAMGDADNYVADLNGSKEWGYLIGLAYEIPDIAFRVSLFYHNEIHHDLAGIVMSPVPSQSARVTQSARAKTLTPQFVNLNIQSGIAEGWLAFAGFRWGDWTALDSINVDAGPLSQSIGLFSQDTLNYNFGLGYRVNESLTLGGYFASFLKLGAIDLPPGIDGEDIRNPESGRFSVGFGGKYEATKQLHLNLGGSYYHIEAGKFVDNDHTVELDTSYALGLGSSLTYHF